MRGCPFPNISATGVGATVSNMVNVKIAEVARLTLRIERDLVATTRLRMLLTDAGTTLSRHRLELREFKARMRRTERLSPA